MVSGCAGQWVCVMGSQAQNIDYFKQIDQVRLTALWIAAASLCLFMYVDSLRFKNQLLIDVLIIRLTLQGLPIAILLFASLSRKLTQQNKRFMFYLAAVSVVFIGIGHAEILELAHKQGQYFPKVGMTIILFYAGILLALPMTLAGVSSFLIIAYAAFTYYMAGLPTEQVISTIVFYAVFSVCCILMNHVCTQILRDNLRMVQQMNHHAHTDSLTKLHNRRYFYEQSSLTHKQANREGKQYAVVLVDLDNFKAINDAMGHLKGDSVLIQVGAILKKHGRRPMDLVARYGGDEFILLLYDANDAFVKDICTKIMAAVAAISDQLSNANSANTLGVSMGVAFHENHEKSNINSLINMADTALYKSKHNGKHSYTIAGRGDFIQATDSSDFIGLA